MIENVSCVSYIHKLYALQDIYRRSFKTHTVFQDTHRCFKTHTEVSKCIDTSWKICVCIELSRPWSSKTHTVFQDTHRCFKTYPSCSFNTHTSFQHTHIFSRLTSFKKKLNFFFQLFFYTSLLQKSNMKETKDVSLVYIYKYTHTWVYIHVVCVYRVCVCVWVYVWVHTHTVGYGVATISRLLKMIGLFCRISSLS